MFSRVLTQVTHIKLSLFLHTKHNVHASVTGSYTPLSSPLFLSTLRSLSLLLASILVVPSFNTFWYLDSINSWCSAPQFLFALTQTATNR
ncbi:unnamed protein product [Hymenolepis diminuta]|uniref:Uncharacterized protein n=1 Tax=Hymenolepis diminuta TaxID=6216 RepID=A0A564YZR8_HYMDI|nr:unnamed protein product [Hymenolepis diminuta]